MIARACGAGRQQPVARAAAGGSRGWAAAAAGLPLTQEAGEVSAVLRHPHGGYLGIRRHDQQGVEEAAGEVRGRRYRRRGGGKQGGESAGAPLEARGLCKRYRHAGAPRRASRRPPPPPRPARPPTRRAAAASWRGRRRRRARSPPAAAGRRCSACGPPLPPSAGVGGRHVGSHALERSARPSMHALRSCHRRCSSFALGPGSCTLPPSPACPKRSNTPPLAFCPPISSNLLPRATPAAVAAIRNSARAVACCSVSAASVSTSGTPAGGGASWQAYSEGRRRSPPWMLVLPAACAASARRKRPNRTPPVAVKRGSFAAAEAAAGAAAAATRMGCRARTGRLDRGWGWGCSGAAQRLGPNSCCRGAATGPAGSGGSSGAAARGSCWCPAKALAGLAVRAQPCMMLSGGGSQRELRGARQGLFTPDSAFGGDRSAAMRDRCATTRKGAAVRLEGAGQARAVTAAPRTPCGHS